MSAPVRKLPSPVMVSVAGRLAEGEQEWVDAVLDVGRQYAWGWWNTLLSRPARAEAELGDRLMVVGSEPLWRLIGGVSEGVRAPWLTPIRAEQRSVRGRELKPGTFGSPGERIALHSEVVGMATGQMLLKPADRGPVSTVQELLAGVAGVRHARGMRPAGREPLEQLEGLALWWLQVDGPPAADDALSVLGVGKVPPRPIHLPLVALSAAWAMLSAHGLTDTVRADSRADLGELASVVFGGVSERSRPAAVVATLDAVVQVLRRLVQTVCTPAWGGGMVVLATPEPVAVPAPRIAAHDFIPGGVRR